MRRRRAGLQHDGPIVERRPVPHEVRVSPHNRVDDMRLCNFHIEVVAAVAQRDHDMNRVFKLRGLPYDAIGHLFIT